MPAKKKTFEEQNDDTRRESREAKAPDTNQEYPPSFGTINDSLLLKASLKRAGESISSSESKTLSPQFYTIPEEPNSKSISFAEDGEEDDEEEYDDIVETFGNSDSVVANPFNQLVDKKKVKPEDHATIISD